MIRCRGQKQGSGCLVFKNEGKRQQQHITKTGEPNQERPASLLYVHVLWVQYVHFCHLKNFESVSPTFNGKIHPPFSRQSLCLPAQKQTTHHPHPRHPDPKRPACPRLMHHPCHQHRPHNPPVQCKTSIGTCALIPLCYATQQQQNTWSHL
jgi:hypothetical protein